MSGVRALKKFDTKVQYLKYQVLREVAKHAFQDNLPQNVADIPRRISPGPEATTRCCVYKERAILSERVRLATGGGGGENVIEVLDIACDECPMGGYLVSNVCRGCIAHRCEEACPRGAITFDMYQKAYIDKSKCVECGRCAKVCPYGAIAHNVRPCERACQVGAVSMDENKAARIDYEKCISCGACVYQCPFGAIQDKSSIIDVVGLIKNSRNNESYRLYAVVAPSISSQFTYAKLGQVIAGIKALGFFHVVEAALGADMVAFEESRELAEKGRLFSSCCPAFVAYVRKAFPGLAAHVSHNLSPAAAISKYLKETSPGARIVFIGPCTAKKMEYEGGGEAAKYVDGVLTFEELQAVFDSADIDVTALGEDVLDNASYYGRIFARSGGLADAVRQGLKEHGIENFEYTPVSCDGIEECKMALLKISKDLWPGNFIEGMACVGGCIGGAGCLTHGPKDKNEVDKYGKEAFEKTITDAISILSARPGRS